MMRISCIIMRLEWFDMQLKVDINKAAGLREITQAADEALTLYRDDMIEDENEMVPVSGGASRNGGGGRGKALARLFTAADFKRIISIMKTFNEYRFSHLKKSGIYCNI